MPDNQNSSEWVMVPREMTDAMREAAGSADDVDDCYSAMLAAAPPAPAMLNGVEERIQRDIEMHGYAEIMQHDFDALRAADNRDAAGESPEAWSLRMAAKEAGQEVRAGSFGIEDTPTAAPAGEAVRWEVRHRFHDGAPWGPWETFDSETAMRNSLIPFKGSDWKFETRPLFAHPPAAEVREAVWIACVDRLPTEADADGIGDVVWRRSGVPILGSVASGKPIDATHWRRTGRAALSPPGRAEGGD